MPLLVPVISDNVIRLLLQHLHHVRRWHSNVLRSLLRPGQAIPVLVNHRRPLLVGVRLLSTDRQLRHQHLTAHRLSLMLLRLRHLTMDQLCIEVLPLFTITVLPLFIITVRHLMRRFVRGLITRIRLSFLADILRSCTTTADLIVQPCIHVHIISLTPTELGSMSTTDTSIVSIQPSGSS